MKKTTIAFALALAAIAGNAEQISESQAMAVASKYIQGTAGRKLVPARGKQQQPTAPYYVFNEANGEGFVIVSGDDELTEIVGYSKTGAFDAADVPQNMQAWLDAYAGYVERVQNGEAEGFKQEVAEMSPAVEALVKTKWNQTAPFWNLCPKEKQSGAQTVTGCVATAMAQVMNYWQWPKSGKGYVSYTPYYTGKVSVDFSKSVYDWDNMVDDYNGSYTQEQADAVAKLMLDCGVSVRMSYSSYASGALDGDVPFALAENFGYKAQPYLRDSYSASGFLSIIKNELDNARPVIFGGQGSAGGHEFVVDGYDTNNFLHVNWGWGGVSDGYFDMALMNPDALGTGGGSGGFTDQQSIVALVPDETMAGDSGQPYLMIIPEGTQYPGYVSPRQKGLKKGEQLDVDVIGVWNISSNRYMGDIAVAVYNEAFERVALSAGTPLQLYGSGLTNTKQTFSLKEELANLPDGKYTIWAVSKSRENADFDWVRVGMENWELLEVKGDDIIIDGGEVVLSLSRQVEMDKEELLPGDKVVFSVSVDNGSIARQNGILSCEIRKASGSRVMSRNVEVALSESSTTVVPVEMTLSKAAVKPGDYVFVVSGFKKDSEVIDVVSEFGPFEFTVKDPNGGIDSPAAAEVAVYPNPTFGEVHVSAEQAVRSVEVYAPDGCLVVRAEDASVLDLSGCPAGVYLLRVKTDTDSTLHRVVKR